MKIGDGDFNIQYFSRRAFYINFPIRRGWTTMQIDSSHPVNFEMRNWDLKFSKN